jgi:hypothetical protein
VAKKLESNYEIKRGSVILFYLVQQEQLLRREINKKRKTKKENDK